jgi:hypothetical protein
MSKEMRKQMDKFKKILTENSAEKSNTFNPNDLIERTLSYIDTNINEIKNSMEDAYYEIVETEIETSYTGEDIYDDAINFATINVEDIMTDTIDIIKREISSIPAQEWSYEQKRFAKEGVTEIDEFVKTFVKTYINMNAYEMLEDTVYSLMREFLNARERDGNV